MAGGKKEKESRLKSLLVSDVITLRWKCHIQDLNVTSEKMSAHSNVTIIIAASYREV